MNRLRTIFRSIIPVLLTVYTAGAQKGDVPPSSEELTEALLLICRPSVPPPEQYYEADLQPHDSTGPYRFADIMPAFIGSLNAYVTQQLRYPESCRERGEEGRVLLEFVVDTTGLIRDLKVLRSCGFVMLDQEAVRIFQPMTDTIYWTPGRHRSRNVPVFLAMPVTFRLD